MAVIYIRKTTYLRKTLNKTNGDGGLCQCLIQWKGKCQAGAISSLRLRRFPFSFHVDCNIHVSTLYCSFQQCNTDVSPFTSLITLTGLENSRWQTMRNRYEDSLARIWLFVSIGSVFGSCSLQIICVINCIYFYQFFSHTLYASYDYWHIILWHLARCTCSKDWLRF